MLRVGLTGGIASGKTTVGRMFVELGCALIDADAIVHQLFQPGQAVNRAVVEAFGPGVIAADGTIDRPALGELIFKDQKARERLNSIVHPAVIQRQKEWLDKLESVDPHGIGIVDAALMIEVGTYRNYDKVIVVVCTEAEQRRRLRERSGLSDDQIDARIRSQMPMEEKAKFADYVIDNSGSLQETRRQVETALRNLRGSPSPSGRGWPEGPGEG